MKISITGRRLREFIYTATMLTGYTQCYYFDYTGHRSDTKSWYTVGQVVYKHVGQMTPNGHHGLLRAILTFDHFSKIKAREVSLAV